MVEWTNVWTEEWTEWTKSGPKVDDPPASRGGTARQGRSLSIRLALVYLFARFARVKA